MTVSVRIIDGPLGPFHPATYLEGTGALCIFEGIVRPTEGPADAPRQIEALTYQVYQPMAQAMLERLAHDSLTRHSLMSVSVEHSRGRVAVGECSFRLVVASAHRKQSLAAMDEFIDHMKREVPIWKTAVARPSSPDR